MEPKGWSKFANLFELTHYTQAVIILVSFLLIYIILRDSSNKKFAHLFVIYALSCICLFVGLGIHMIFFPATGRLSAVVIESSNTIFAIIELSVFVIFFFQIIDSKNSKRFLLLLIAMFFLSIAFFIAKVSNTHSESSEIMRASVIVNILEFSIFLVSILSYFIELFTKPPTQDLTRTPAFWISSGLFIYTLASLPLLLFGEYVWLENESFYFSLFAIHYLSLSLLLLTISKAFLCQIPPTA